MSREIRFRVWDEEAEIFVYSSEEDENYFWLFENGRLQVMRRTSELEYVEGIAVAEYPSAEEIDSEIEQYIDINDSEGVEIYEKDIMFWDGSVLGIVRFDHAEYIVGEGVNPSQPFWPPRMSCHNKHYGHDPGKPEISSKSDSSRQSLHRLSFFSLSFSYSSKAR